MKATEVFKVAYSYLEQMGITEEQINWMDRIPPIEEMSDEYFMAEMAWCVYNAGMKETVIRQKWDSLRHAYCYFDIDAIITHKEQIIDRALKVFKHKQKAEAVVAGASKVYYEGPMKIKLPKLSKEGRLKYLESFPFIGKVTKYHLARNIGMDVVKPDRHLVRLTEFLSYLSPDDVVAEISQATGIREGTVDYILWQWLAIRGMAAYQDIDRASA